MPKKISLVAIWSVVGFLINGIAARQGITFDIQRTSISGFKDLGIEGTYEHSFSEYYTGGVNYDIKKHPNRPHELYLNAKLGPKKFAKFIYDIRSRVTEAVITAQQKKTKWVTTLNSTWKDMKLEISHNTEGLFGNKLFLNPTLQLAIRDDILHINTEVSLIHDFGESTAVDFSFVNLMETAYVKVSQKLSDSITFSPIFDVSARTFVYKYEQKIHTTSHVEAELDVVSNAFNLKWDDEGKSGTWTTKLNLPLDDLSGGRISLRRSIQL